ncbi:hypothetical protein [Erwinia sp. E602]|uniref:hypothetical protein n=1 Tax=Erwinia sp. E602 TaxID=2675378 RepID=UPI001BA5DE2F|nr:hypothetical protein [Erwinia sp. E602]
MSYKKESELKSKTITVRLTESQQEAVDSLISTGKAKTNASAIQYLINQYMILGK